MLLLTSNPTTAVLRELREVNTRPSEFILYALQCYHANGSGSVSICVMEFPPKFPVNFHIPYSHTVCCHLYFVLGKSAKQVPPSMNNLVGNFFATAVDMATTPLDPSKMTSLMTKLCPGVDFSFVKHNQSTAESSSDTSNQPSPPEFVQEIMSALKTPTNVHPNNPPIPATPATPVPNYQHHPEDVGDSTNETGLFDAVEKHRFPQGFMCYEVNQPDFKPSYTALCYSNSMSRNNNSRLQKMTCLGIFNCPVDG